MPELEAILDLAELARTQGEEVCLVTVVGVEGSSYRKPGARMLLTRSGRRAGTISGGCLEGEVSKKAWWLTENGPSVQRYSSFFDEDSGIPYGLGCGGTIILLLERGSAVEAVLEALRLSVRERQPAAVITSLQENSSGTKLVMNAAGEVLYSEPGLNEADRAALRQLAGETLSHGSGNHFLSREDESGMPLFCERVAPPPALWVFGAGDDARPVVDFAYNLGWHITVADGRSHLARPERFPHAHRVFTVTQESSANLSHDIGPHDAVVLMTHSYEQDRMLLGRLLPLPLSYLGILGPRRRTMHMLGQILEQQHPETGGSLMTLDEVPARLHSPVGLDISAHTPAAIALSIVAEVQSVLAANAADACSDAAHPPFRAVASVSSHAL